MESLKIPLEQHQEEVSKLKLEISNLKEQLEWFTRQLFGKRSERYAKDLDKNQLFFEGFEPPEGVKEEEKKRVEAHERRKPTRNGQDSIKIPPDLPVERVFLDIPEEKKICQKTGLPLVKIGEEVSHKLAHKPGSYFIKEIIRPKYVHPQEEEAGIVTEELPETLLAKCLADDSLLAEIVTKKFSDHLPLYRIAELMGREGIRISRKLLSQWILKIGMALKPLYEKMVQEVLGSRNIFIDETPINLFEKIQCKQAYMWVVVGGNEANPPYRIYSFYDNRCHQNVMNLLGDYQGCLHSDKYGAYEKMAKKKDVIWCPCWGHIRRKFFEAEGGDPEFRKWVLRKIRYLFLFERIAWTRSESERLKIRQEKEGPIIDELINKIKTRLIEGAPLPKSKFREALGYFCSLIPYLKNYTLHPFARLDNNVAERSVRPLAIGRKNWLFFGSEEGGEAGAILFSLVQTCRGLEINPREYLHDVMKRLLSHPAKKLRELLPDQWLLEKKTLQKFDS